MATYLSTDAMKTILKLLLASQLATCALAQPAPTTTNKDWENACGGSNIAITRQGSTILSIEAFAEHFHESREWTCHFADGKIISAHYRSYTITRHLTDDPEKEGSFTTKLTLKTSKTYHFPDHKLDKLPEAQRKDLTEILKIAQSPTPAK